MGNRGQWRKEDCKARQQRDTWPTFLFISGLRSKQSSPHLPRAGEFVPEWEMGFLPPFLTAIYDKLWVSSCINDMAWFETAAGSISPGWRSTEKNRRFCLHTSSFMEAQRASWHSMGLTHSLLFLIRSSHHFARWLFLKADKGVSLKLQGNGWILMESNWLLWLSQRSCGHKS